MTQDLNDFRREERVVTYKIIISLIHDTIRFTAVIAGALLLQFIIKLLGCESEFWARMIHVYVDPAFILSFITISVVRISRLIFPSFNHKNIEERQKPLLELCYDNDFNTNSEDTQQID